MALGAFLVLSAALGLPSGATCSYDAGTATVQVQMHSARTVVASAGDGRILVDGRACATVSLTRQIVVASAFPPASDTVVVDERRGRLADPATGRRPKLYALTGTGADTMEVIGTPGRDRYVARDDLGASIDLDADGTPDFVRTDVGHIVLRGMAGDDVLSDGRSGHDRLACGPGIDTVRAGAADTVTGCERTLPRRRA
jgi:Ca2+-binding RTX toxin-like protein